MTDEYDEHGAFFNRRADKTIISRRIEHPPPGRDVRIASHILDGQPGLAFAKLNDEVVLRRTPARRFEIKATFLEDDRTINVLTIQKYNSRSDPFDKYHFSFVGAEIDALLEFVAGLRSIEFTGPGKVHVSDDALRDVVLNQVQARRVFAKNSELFLQLAQQEYVAQDLVAVGYRRKQLERFERLLGDEEFFDAERQRLQCRPEDVWQRFFEANTWIFGYGLSYLFLSSLDGRKLEQIVRGRSLVAAGKRADAVMKTRGLVSSLCFVEVKRHDSPLLSSSDYRADAWQPSKDLTGGVAQVHATVQAALDDIRDKLVPQDETGAPTSEVLFNVSPRSFLVIGSLRQFQTEHGIHEPKFRSFELYRRHMSRPEIITFDELLERTRFIVEHPPSEGLLES